MCVCVRILVGIFYIWFGGEGLRFEMGKCELLRMSLFFVKVDKFLI